MLFEVLIGPGGSIPIIIRDDDTNFFTTQKMLESVYSEAWSKGFKISLSVVPFQRGIDDISVPPHARRTNRYYSVANNKALIAYLREQISHGRLEVLQHGFAHDYSNGNRGEFGGESDKKKEIESGKNMLSQEIGLQPRFFVPPGEDISNTNLKNVAEAQLIPFCRRTFFDRFMRSKNLPNFAKGAAINIYRRRYMKGKSRENNEFSLHLLRSTHLYWEKNAITWSVPTAISLKKAASTDSLLKWAKRIIDSSFEKRNPICMINHYHIYFYDWSSYITQVDLHNTWQKIIESLNSLAWSWKVTLSELYDRLSKIRSVRITKTGSKITIVSNVYIENFSIRTDRIFESNSQLVRDEENPRITTIRELVPQDKTVLYF
jgi:hypothetical protein